MLSNMLLVLGMCFFLGGIANMRDDNGVGREQSFSPGTAQTTCSLMALTSAATIIPTTLYGAIVETDNNNNNNKHEIQARILALSRGISAILLLLYCLYLFFALHTHKQLFEPQAPLEEQDPPLPSLHQDDDSDSDSDSPPSSDSDSPPSSASSFILLLLLVTLLISYCANYMVASIDDLIQTAHLSKKFIGLILIPIVGNAAEHATAVVVAIKDKMDLAMAVAIGSTIQIALLATPALVMAGWATGREMSLQFELGKSTVLLMFLQGR